MPNPNLISFLYSFLILAGTNGSSGAESVVSRNGNQLVTEAAVKLKAHESIRCKLSIQINQFGQQMIAEGAYRQLGATPRKLFRIELALQAGRGSASLLQVCDGNFVWTRRKVGQNTDYRRIDLRRVEQAIEQTPADSPINPLQVWLAVGGLPRLFVGLQKGFEFETARASQLGDVDVWTVVGRWRGSVQVDSATTGKDGPLLSRIPETVHLMFDKTDLFPYFIKFTGPANTALKSGEDSDATLHVSTMIIQTADIILGGDPLDVHTPQQDFTFRPGTISISDSTDAFLKQLGLK